MNESLYLNKISFLEKKEKKFSLIPWISLLLSILFFCSCLIEIQFSLPTYAIYQSENQTLVIAWDLQDIKSLSSTNNMKINQSIFPFQIANMGEIEINEKEMKNYQKIEIKSPIVYQNNQIIQIYLLDKKEKIIKKIKKLIS